MSTKTGQIKICEKNRDAIEAALSAANHGATAHTFTNFCEVTLLAEHAETHLIALIGAKRLAVGAVVVVRSGGALPSAYSYYRVTTRVELVRRSSAWWLVSVSSEQSGREAGKLRITLTHEQDAAAIAILRRQYTVEA